MVLVPVKFPLHRRVRVAQGLWLLSWLAVLSGAFTFCMGVYLKTELLRREEVMDNSEIHVVPNILMVVGLAYIGTNWFAGRVCQDSLDLSKFPRWKPYMLPWFLGSAVLCSLLLTAVVLSYALQGSLEESLKVGLRNGIRFYRDTDVPGRCFQKETIDRLQMQLQCCGNTNYRDWFEVQWVNNRYLDYTAKEVKDRVRSNVDGRYLVDGVPFSCCNPMSARPCIQRRLLDNNAHFNYEYQTEKLNLYSRGCREALVDYYMGLMNRIGPCVLLVIVLQITILVSLRYLQTAVDRAMALEDPGAETEGYILENGVKETFEETKNKVLTLLKIVKVNAGGGETEAVAEASGEAEGKTETPAAVS